jgi:hypothetical protein
LEKEDAFNHMGECLETGACVMSCWTWPGGGESLLGTRSPNQIDCQCLCCCCVLASGLWVVEELVE